MKHKLKSRLPSIGVILAMLLMMMGCQSDDFDSEDASGQSASPFKMRMISLAEVNTNPLITEQLQKFKTKSSNDLSREVYNAEYDFTVNTEFAKYIESDDGSFHSYTFLIEPQDNDDTIENLVLSSQPDGSYTSEIVVYNFLDNGQVEINTAPLDNFDTAEYFSRFNLTYVCTTTITYTSWLNDDCSCQYIEIENVETNCSYSYYSSPEYVDVGDSATGGWGNMVWTSGGGPSSNTNIDFQDVSIATSPFTQSHLDRLTAQTKNSLIKARIQQMEGDLNNVDKEQGSEFRRLASDGTIGVSAYTEYLVPEADRGFDYVRYPNVQQNSEVRVHMHHNSTQLNANGDEEALAPTFSIEDVFGMSEFYKQKRAADANLTRDGNLSSILVSRRGLYALRVTNPEKALEFNEYLTNGAENANGDTYEAIILKGFRKEVIDKTVDQCNGGCDDAMADALFELNFINFFKQLDTGLGLFVSYETDDDGNYIWIFLTN